MNNMDWDSSVKILFLLNLLCRKKASKNEIIEEFKKNNIDIKKTSINHYINKLLNNEIPISVEKIKNENYYFYNKKYDISFKIQELNAVSDVKKLLIKEKNWEIIRKAMSAFYKFALNIQDKNTRIELINFDYYSKINWALVGRLIQHCKNKDVIILDYMLPNAENKYLTFHADTIKVSDWSTRLYLSGILYGDNKLSQLPIDKIFMIKKVVKEKARMNLKTKVLTYKVSKEMFKKTGLDEKEGLSEIKNKMVTIKRPLDDTFFTLQRLLYFCPELYYVSDVNIKNLLKEKLYTLKDMYSGGIDE